MLLHINTLYRFFYLWNVYTKSRHNLQYIKCCIAIIAIIVIIIIYLFISRKCDQPVKDILIMEGSVINKHIVD